MPVLLRIAICIGGIILIVIARRANVLRKITEKQSLFWIFTGSIIISFGLFPSVVYYIADLFGVEHPPSIIFAIFIMLLTYGVFHCYKVNADLSDKIKELAMLVTLLNEENIKLKGKDEYEEKNISND